MKRVRRSLLDGEKDTFDICAAPVETNDEVLFYQREGWIISEIWGIHRELEIAENRGMWVVTHIPTGLSICRGIHKANDVEKIVNRLLAEEAPTDWTSYDLDELEKNEEVVKKVLDGISFVAYDGSVLGAKQDDLGKTMEDDVPF